MSQIESKKTWAGQRKLQVREKFLDDQSFGLCRNKGVNWTRKDGLSLNSDTFGVNRLSVGKKHQIR